MTRTEGIPVRATVVINTYNRADFLPNAVRSLAAQTHPDLELVIVNGPSTDTTEAVLDALSAEGIRFKRARCASRNLSESRNIGIAAASGEVVFFIDDDAVAHREWVARAMRRYADEDVGAVGGFTYDHTGMGFQCRYTVCDRFGNARYLDSMDPAGVLSGTDDFYFPSLLGTNCSFRVSELKAIGGFDEVFAYMLDETDVCLRIHERGKRIVTVPNAFVFHKYAPSHARTPERIPSSLLAPARSKVYFCLKHYKGAENSLEVFTEVDRFRRDIGFANRWYLDHKKVGPAHYEKLTRELSDGITEGLRLGMDPAVRAARTRHLAAAVPKPFLPILSEERRAARSPRALRIYLVSQGYPPHDTAGIARWTAECAGALAALGHEVHVITRSRREANHVDYEDGVWVHSMMDLFDDELLLFPPVSVPRSILRRAGAVVREIRRCESVWGVDLVSAPIWDIEGILCAKYLDVPVITSLHTTYKLAMPFKPEWLKNADYRVNHVNKVIAGERWLLEQSPHILANSREVVSEINSAYDAVLERRAGAVTLVPHGVSPPAAAKAGAPEALAPAAGPRILFVGRIEPRKGPDQLLAALLHLKALPPGTEIVLAGWAPEEGDAYRAKVMALAESVRAKFPAAKVVFTGYVSDAQLEALYASASLFVAPSRFESFGLILVEAMRHGVPVIACDIGGMREIVTDGQDGYLFAVDDTQRLAERIGALLQDPGLRDGIGAKGRATYQAKFTARAMGASLEAFYRRAIEGAKA